MWLPMEQMLYTKAIRTHGHSTAMHGCETTRPADQILNAYTSNILDNIHFKSGKSSVDITFDAASRGEDVDPNTEKSVRRVSTLRRTLAKDPTLKRVLDDTLK